MAAATEAGAPQPPDYVADVWLGFKIFINIWILNLLLGGPWAAPGWPAWGWKYSQDHSFYFTKSKSQPDLPHLTPIREGFWLGSWALTNWDLISSPMSATG